jgi:hypothetical protein
MLAKSTIESIGDGCRFDWVRENERGSEAQIVVYNRGRWKVTVAFHQNVRDSGKESSADCFNVLCQFNSCQRTRTLYKNPSASISTI